MKRISETFNQKAVSIFLINFWIDNLSLDNISGQKINSLLLPMKSKSEISIKERSINYTLRLYAYMNIEKCNAFDYVARRNQY